MNSEGVHKEAKKTISGGISKKDKCPLAVCALRSEKQPYACYGVLSMPKCETDGNHENCPIYEGAISDDPRVEIRYLMYLGGCNHSDW